MAAGLIDTHTHLESFVRQGRLASALERASEAGIESVITIGTSPDDWTVYRELARTHRRQVHYTVGLHPCSVDANWEKSVEQLADFWGGDAGSTDAFGVEPRPVALGEIGLDRFHLPKDAEQAERIFAWQRSAFLEQLAIAKRFGCPIVIHSRGAFAECLEAIDASGVDWAGVVFHCFTEGPPEMHELMRRGGVGSFTGILTYKNADAVRAAAKVLGLTRLMLETDAPYLTPMPHRGKPNEPAFVRLTAEFAASEVFGVDYKDLAAATSQNARKFYGLGSS